MRDALLIMDGGMFSSVQDAGRFGYQRFGISASGAMDGLAMRLANALVGNPLDMAVIETTLSGPVFVVEGQTCRLAVTGMEARITLNGTPVPPYQAFEAQSGDRVAIGPGKDGLRGYLGIAGGLSLEPFLGSRSTHSRSRIGGFEGRQLAGGDRLALTGTALVGPCLGLSAADRPTLEGPVRVLLGPQDDAFTLEGIEMFLSSTYVVSSKTDRMGCQFDGPAIAHRAGFNIVSDGIMNGSIQVPGHGRPIVLLADRQTTGGYPKIATVIEPDLRKLAQARPGSAIRFAAVSADEAEAIAIAERRRIADLIAGMHPVVTGAAQLTAERLLGLNLISGVHFATLL